MSGEELLWFAVTLTAGAIPGVLLMRTKVPMGGIIGSMIGVSILNLITGKAVFLGPVRTVIMILAGAMIGSKIGREEFRSAGKMLTAVGMVWVTMICFNLVIGGVIYKTSNLDIATSLFSVMPGGGTEMAIISEELGGSPVYVGLMQVFRGVLFLLIVPPLFAAIVRTIEKKGNTGIKTRARDISNINRNQSLQEGMQSGTESRAPDRRYTREELVRLAGLIAFSAMGGLLFNHFRITGGLLIGGVVFGIVYSVIFGKSRYPERLPPVQMVLAGSYLGLSVTMDAVRALKGLLVPVIVMTVGVVIFSLLSGIIMWKITKMDLITCFLAASPCGVAELALISEELGADTSIVAIVQAMRFVFVVSLFPIMITWVCHLAGG